MTKRKLGKGPRKPETPKKPRPRDQRLPGTEDTVIQEIENAAESYAAARDERMELTKVEVERKSAIMATMKRHGKRHYKRDGIESDIVTESESVKVKIHKPATDTGVDANA